MPSPKHMSVQNGAMDVSIGCDWSQRLTSVISPAHVCVHSTTQARARISQGGGGVLFGGKVDLKPKGGSSFGKNVAKGWNKILGMGNWGGRPTPPPPRPPWLRAWPGDQEMLVTIGIAYYYMKRVNRQIWVHRGPIIMYALLSHFCRNFLPSMAL